MPTVRSKEYQLSKNEEEFLIESNKIEGINRSVKQSEKDAFLAFKYLGKVTVEDLSNYVKAIQPGAILRNKEGLNVRVGSYFPPKGGKAIEDKLNKLLFHMNTGTIHPYDAHQKYESLHPFTDGNGRSGRMLWWWMTGGSSLGFLHAWYYASLEQWRK